jgi:type VI secretion system secreted protein Hcp
LKLDGIVGESKHVAHHGEIEVLSWSWGLSAAATTAGGGGGGAGKVSFQDFHVTARISKASPALFLACATGKHMKHAHLSGLRGGAGGGELLEVVLADVVITSYQQSDAEDDAPLEQFTLTFATIETTYFPPAADGKSGAEVTASYDLKTATGH